jgi:hypothetical protein
VDVNADLQELAFCRELRDNRVETLVKQEAVGARQGMWLKYGEKIAKIRSPDQRKTYIQDNLMLSFPGFNVQKND